MIISDQLEIHRNSCDIFYQLRQQSKNTIEWPVKNHAFKQSHNQEFFINELVEWLQRVI